MADRGTVRLPDGRDLAYAWWGAERGPVVVLHHGTPGGRLVDTAWTAEAESLGIRLLSHDRPGYGDSTPAPGRSVTDVAQDLGVLLDELGVGTCTTFGWSGGGPHALALAALLPDRVTAVATSGCPGPADAETLDFLEGMAEGNADDFSANRTREEEIAECAAFHAAFADGSAASYRAAFSAYLGPEDLTMLDGPVLDFLAAQLRDALAPGVEGWADDGLALVRPWGFAFEDVRCPVWIVHGERDVTSPVGHGRWLAAALPTATATHPPDSGHIGPVATMVSDLLTWLRDTGR